MTHYKRTTYFKMIPSLLLIEIAVSLFHIKRRMFLTKLKANYNIIKNLKRINSRYNEIQKKRKISDKEIITKFSDDISVPPWVIEKNDNDYFNKILIIISKLSRKVI